MYRTNSKLPAKPSLRRRGVLLKYTLWLLFLMGTAMVGIQIWAAFVYGLSTRPLTLVSSLVSTLAIGINIRSLVLTERLKH